MADAALGLLAGLAAGLVFFGGLHFTLSRLSTVKHPMLLVVVSFFARSAVLVGTLVAVADGHAVRVVVALIGILTARTILVSRAKLEAREESTWT